MDIPPDKWLGLTIICLIILLASPNFAQAPLFEENTDRIIIIQENTIKAVSMPVFVAYSSVYGVLIDKGMDYDQSDLLDKVILCESGGDPKAKNPKSTARGLLQIIESSERACEKGLGRELDMYNSEDNLLCGNWLLNHGGLVHWKSSRECWNK